MESLHGSVNRHAMRRLTRTIAEPTMTYRRR
jgi:hypothetical protein